jgi:prepilin-type N-terminal cleavage/methylation domain-containing protein
MLHKQSKSNLQLRKNNQGMTLIEVIAVVAVLGVVMAAVLGFMITGAKMSAKVSGTATDSIKEQTAVEFINRRIWEANATVEDQISKPNHSYNGYYGCLKLGVGIYITTENPDKDNATVVYCIGENKKIELCPGSIYFKIENKTVTYVLNEKEHVVYPRIGS